MSAVDVLAVMDRGKEFILAFGTPADLEAHTAARAAVAELIEASAGFLNAPRGSGIKAMEAGFAARKRLRAALAAVGAK